MNSSDFSPIIAGMMRLSSLSAGEARSFLDFLADSGVRWFDHADIYGDGRCEEIFGVWLRERPDARESMVIQSKCGIVPGVCYDSSKEHIIKSADGILSRLDCGYLDYLLIHRPDILWEPDEIASAVDQLISTGKVRAFGVANCNPAQIEYLSSVLNQKIEINQIQLSPAFAPSISENLETNTYSQNGMSRSMGVIDYCRSRNIALQAWSPLQYGTFAGTYLNNPNYTALNARLQECADRYGVSKAAVAGAWICRIPPRTQVVIGTCNRDHFAQMLKIPEIKLTRQEWYGIYTSAGYSLP